MAFKNEDIAIHLNEQFEQPTWESYARELLALEEWTKGQNREYMVDYLKRPDVQRRKQAYDKAYYQNPEKRAMKAETERRWREAHKEEYKERRKQYHAKRDMEKKRETNRRYAAKKRAERLASAQQLSANQP